MLLSTRLRLHCDNQVLVHQAMASRSDSVTSLALCGGPCSIKETVRLGQGHGPIPGRVAFKNWPLATWDPATLTTSFHLATPKTEEPSQKMEAARAWNLKPVIPA